VVALQVRTKKKGNPPAVGPKKGVSDEKSPLVVTDRQKTRERLHPSFLGEKVLSITTSVFALCRTKDQSKMVVQKSGVVDKKKNEKDLV